MDNKLKVVHFVAAIDQSLGGVSMYIQLLTKELGKLVDLTVVTRPTKNPLHLEKCRLVYLPLPLSELPAFRKQWIDFLETEQPDIVHINGIWMIQTWIIQKEALKRQIPTFITPHGMLEPWILHRNYHKKQLAMLLYQRKSLRKARKLIATAESERQNILKLGINNNIAMIPNGIDISTITMKTDWSVKKKILYLSRLHQKKGIELLMETLHQLRCDLDGYKVTIAGDGEPEYLASLKTRVKELGLENIVDFAGAVYGGKKWELFRQSDFFVLPTYGENFGYVVAEALACGTPVITTKGTPWEELETAHCGLWIERTKTELSAAIKKLSSLDCDGLRQLGTNGRHLVETKYSSAQVAKSLYKLYTGNGKRTMV